MNVEVVGGGELTAGLKQRWSELQESDPKFASPYLCPDFTAAAAAVRDDVHVGILHEDGEIVGFFPFQRAGDDGTVVAEGVSDYQAVIVAPGVRWTAEELLRASGLRSWSFTYLIAGQEPFRPFHNQHFTCAAMDLSRGYAGWVEERRAAGSRLIKDTGRHRRRLEHEAGPLRFELHVEDRAVLHQLMQWKTAQYLRTGKTDWFAISWVRDLLEALHATQTERFSGLLSALWAGDRLVAAHFGIRSRRVWHWWYPAYDRSFARDSPGLILDLWMAEQASRLGIERIDLGKVCEHKARLMSATYELARGCARIQA
ncbi:MAG TPA: GNAT family N-acetyltransferase [Thermoanaerobaculia bacterium]|nr:GNAT family N-acetyltransferase [Thermoanaerobaculia bacterium]